jgi:ABC-type phosphate transport system substrate-binding protein
MKSRIAVGLVLALCGMSSHAELVVIVNPKNPAANLTPDQVAAMYLGNATTFPNGDSMSLLDQSGQGSIRDEFYQKATGRSLAQVKATWARITFTGKAVPPKELKNDSDVKALVASDLKAIGYVDASAVDASVKIVLKL